MLLAYEDDSRTFVTRSEDGGRTFSPPVSLVFPEPGLMSGAYEFAADGMGGVVAIGWHQNRLVSVFSRDGGLTFSAGGELPMNEMPVAYDVELVGQDGSFYLLLSRGYPDDRGVLQPDSLELWFLALVDADWELVGPVPGATDRALCGDAGLAVNERGRVLVTWGAEIDPGRYVSYRCESMGAFFE
ncbi:MAG: hypothetical protein HYV63_13730 [Candidatus Schekmanbacteria bacterium]|nr:hypothetical protein [Candidatus Schekmanbacteria bacterium]